MKKPVKSLMAFFLAAVLTFGSVSFTGIQLPLQSPFILTANAETSDIYTYTVSDGKATITRCSTSASGAITIPSTLGGYPVTAIGPQAFYKCTGLTSVAIPGGLTSIGVEAFNGCTGMADVAIPDSVTSIGQDAFYNTAWYYAQPNNFLVYAGKVAYIYKGLMPSNTSIQLRSDTVGIANCAFNGCTRLKGVTIPDGVIGIGEYAFNNCTGLNNLTIPNSVTKIGRDAFSNTAWYNNQPDGLVYAGKVAYRYKGAMPSNTAVQLKTDTLSIADNAFYGCSDLTSVTIPASMKSIGNYAFYGCNGLTSVTIPVGVTSIGNYAFYGCSGLTSVTLSPGLTSIGNSAFSSCAGLTSVTIPGSVTSIGKYAFNYCTGLTGVMIQKGVTSIEENAFSLCSKLLNVTIPDSVTSIGSYAFGGCTSLTSARIPESVMSIAVDAFLHCWNLVITGMAGSYVQTYAAANGIAFKALYLAAKTGSDCVIDEQSGWIYGLAPGIASLDDFVSAAQGYQVECQPGPGGFGTGSLAFIKQGDAVIKTYTVLIYGDVNGDGNIDAGDAGLIVDYENYFIPWDPVADAVLYEATDINGDNNSDSCDAGIVVDYENFLLTIDQATGLAVLP